MLTLQSVIWSDVNLERNILLCVFLKSLMYSIHNFRLYYNHKNQSYIRIESLTIVFIWKLLDSRVNDNTSMIVHQQCNVDWYLQKNWTVVLLRSRIPCSKVEKLRPLTHVWLKNVKDVSSICTHGSQNRTTTLMKNRFIKGYLIQYRTLNDIEHFSQ